MPKLFESGENYLETILRLKKKLGEVRSIDVANELEFSKPSVSRAVGIMKKGEYITVDEKGFIHFTEKGLLKARAIYERHRLITQYLITALGVDQVTAEEDACKIEHIISEKTFERIKNFLSSKE